MMASLDDKLLVAVSQHPVLYNHTRADYKNAEAKTKAWEEIQAELNIDERKLSSVTLLLYLVE